MECHGGRHPYIATEQAPVDATRCPNWNLSYERQCEQVAGHDGWHGFMWDWTDQAREAHWWPSGEAAAAIRAADSSHIYHQPRSCNVGPHSPVSSGSRNM
jgi:hypothetical protein